MLRNTRTNLFKFALAGTLLSTGCKWTEFDDLEDKAWVVSTEKPNSNSNDYGVALVRGARVSDDGGTLVVLGAGEALYSELLYKATGSASLDSKTEIKLNKQFGIGNLDLQPVLLADPASDDVALLTNSGADGSIAVLTGTHTLVSSQVHGPSNPDGGTYMVAPSQVAATKPSQLLVAAQDAVYGPPATPQPKCALVDVDNTTPVSVRGVAAARLSKTDSDDIVVWSSTGKLYIYDGAAFDGCATHATLLSIPVDVGFLPATNANMHIVEGHFLVLAGHHDSDLASIVAVYDLSNMNGADFEPKPVGAPLAREGLKSSTLLDAEGIKYLLVGYPAASVSGTVSGEVLAYTITTTTGIDPTQVTSFHDAQPEGNQQFGRAVTTFQYNGKQILAVSADNEVFVYYQSSLYAETRR